MNRPQTVTSFRIITPILVAVLVALLVFALSPALPGQAGAPYRSAKLAQVQPGNYCVSCHTPGDERLAAATAWTGSIEREVVSPCGAAGRVHEEIYYTDRMLLAIARARAGIPARLDASKTDARIASARQTYSRLLDMPANSLDAVSSEASVLRYRLGKSYNWLNQAREAVKRQWVLLVAAAVTVVLLASLGWGWKNISRYSIKTAASPAGGRFRFGFKAVLFVVLLFILFALPIFRTPVQEVESASEEEQARQTALDTAGRVADATDRALARTWALARVAAAWAKLNPEQAGQALEEALVSANQTQMNADALWGEAQAAYEGAVGSPAALEKAGLVAARLNATNSRAWALRLIAAEWASVDPARAEQILQQALDLTVGRSGIYRELDVRGIAVTWAAINPAQGVAVADRIYNPAIKTWALWEIAAITGDSSLYNRAAETARQVDNPVDRARLLREVAVHSGNSALFDEALSALEGVEGAALAYALSDLAAASGNAALAKRIDPAYPDALAAALYRLGRFQEAWDAAAKIADPFDRAHAQAAIAGAWGNAEMAQQIADPTLRDRALRDIAVAAKDATLAAGIESPYYRVQALTGLGQYQAALDAAAGLSDTYPLRALAVAWAESDPQAALKVVDMMDREADKAEALRVIAAATGDEAAFERALNLALAARVRGDSLAPVEASLALGRAFAGANPARAEAAFAQAYEVAGRISTKYK